MKKITLLVGFYHKSDAQLGNRVHSFHVHSGSKHLGPSKLGLLLLHHLSLKILVHQAYKMYRLHNIAMKWSRAKKKRVAFSNYVINLIRIFHFI